MNKPVIIDMCSGESWQEAALNEGTEYIRYSSAMLDSSENRSKAVEEIRALDRAKKILVLFSEHGMNKESEDFFAAFPAEIPLVPIGSSSMLINRGNLPPQVISDINRYVIYGGSDNIIGAVKYIKKNVFGMDTEVPPPDEKPFDGIYSIDGDKVYSSLEEYLDSQSVKYSFYVGILSHRSSWTRNSLQIEKALAEELNRIGVGAVPVFSYGESGETVQSLDFGGIVSRYFSRNGQLFIKGLVNFQMHLIHARDGLSVAERSVLEYSKLNIPVFHPIDSYYLTEKQWRELDNPMAMGMQSTLSYAEMAGMTEPVLIGLREEKTRTPVPVQRNIALFAQRVKKWAQLSVKSSSEKKAVIILHNSVCAGVEATVGKAFGLDVFQSVVNTLKSLSAHGYRVENIPADGRALHRLIMEKKAFSDFRWTSAEDIVHSGGCIYRMSCKDEYMKYFSELTPVQQEQMTASWGAPEQSEGMFLDGSFIITGVNFGNITVMVQPKRGCYGAKCTGEVCRILHDPCCPPAHQYIATYRYIERVLKADAVIHFGTDGSLEYLPGKSNALTENCWPLTVLGTLPNIYPYHTGVVSEGMIAKRRANACLIGYYPPASAGTDKGSAELMDRLNAYSEAASLDNGQDVIIKAEITALLDKQENAAAKKLLQSAASFAEGVQLVRAQLLQAASGRKLVKPHIFGENPDRDQCVDYISEMLYSDGIIPRGENETEFDYCEKIRAVVSECIAENDRSNEVYEDICRVYNLLQLTCGEENALLNALDGGYTPAGESGMPDENGRKILPTGKNFFSENMDKIPTPSAYLRGKELAEQLISAYLDDEKRYPEKIAMNMISIDIARTKGEQLSQFLYLLGVKPVWDSRGRVTSLEVIPVSELGRPRIDVTLRISGVMRDTWPDAVSLLDEAVLTVSALDETDEENYVLKNISRMKKECGDMGRRAETIRIFGDPPGTYGAGIDLALKASAWNSEKDLARYFIQSSAFAYGKGLNGRKSIREFIENAKNIDLSCDVSSSRRMDTLACGFGLQVHGGFRLVAKTIGKKEIRQYQSSNEVNTALKTRSLSQSVEEDIKNTLLNEFWKENTKQEEYRGAAEMMHRMQNVFDAQCTSECIGNDTLDELARQYVNDEEMRRWLTENNRYAAEEIARRLLELESRGKWKPDENVLEELRRSYLAIEGDMESGNEGFGEIQGGSVEIIGDEKVEKWQDNLKEIDSVLKDMGV